MQLRQLYTQQPTAQQLADYANAMLNVNNYAYAITNQSLPVLDYPPKDYGDFASRFGTAKLHALNWTDNIFVAMIQLPITIKEQASTMFSLEETLIEMYLNNLIANPNDATSKKALAKALEQVQTIIQNQLTSVSAIKGNLSQFSQDIYDDAKALTQISEDASKDVENDKETLADIQGDINSLKDDINTANILMAVSEMAIGIDIFVCIIGIAVCTIGENPAVGGGIIAVAVTGIAAGITGTVVESLRIKSMQAEIDADQKQIDGLNQDIIMLQAVSTTFNSLYDANQKAHDALIGIESMWTSLNQTIEDVKTELTQVDTDTTGTQYQEALDAFKQAETNWNEVVAFANLLAGVNYNWQDKDGNWHKYTDQSPQANQAMFTQIPSKILQAA